MEGAEEGLGVSEAVAVEAEPWVLGRGGGTLTSIVPTVRSQQPISPVHSTNSRKIRPHTYLIRRLDSISREVQGWEQDFFLRRLRTARAETHRSIYNTC